jgi:hypothetical protein
MLHACTKPQSETWNSGAGGPALDLVLGDDTLDDELESASLLGVETLMASN